jgi:hypothetical protein
VNCRNPWGSKPHRFAVEELLDSVVRSPNSHSPAPAKGGGSVPSELDREEADTKGEELLAYDGRGGGPK